MQEKYRPDYKRIKSNIGAVSAAKRQLEKIIAADSAKRAEIASAADRLRAVSVTLALKAIDIEELNAGKQGVRVQALRAAGYNTVADIINVPQSRLEAVNGIGAQSAEKIKALSADIFNSLSRNTSIRLSVDDKTPESTQLIKLVYDYKTRKPVYDRARVLYEASGDVADDLQSAKCAGGRLRWMFAGAQQKEKARAACERLETLVGSGYASEINELYKIESRALFAAPTDAMGDFEKSAAQYYTLLEELGVQKAGEKEAVAGLTEDFVEEINQVELDLTGLSCDLRGYQKFGVKYIIHQRKVLLGDEMGLGKTVQAIASVVALRNSGENHFLAVCPASVLINWCREIKKFCDINCYKLHGKDVDDELLRWKKFGGIAVTTYETLKKVELSSKFRLGMLIVDEAHYVKNPSANRTKNLLAILGNARNVLFMTGTALENRVDEMSFLIGCLRPDVAENLKNIGAISKAPEFRRIIAPVYFRRTREDVLKELPDLIEKEEWCVITDSEYRAYRDSAMSENYMSMRQVSFLGVEPENSSKLERLLEICEEAKDDGRKILVFSFFINTIEMIGNALGNRCLEPITGSIQPKRRQEIVDEFDKAPEGAILLSQIQAGGTGLNIQSASVVIICEPQIKPSIEHQAISRAYRMGQSRSVSVHRLLADETIDERVLELLRSKQMLFDNFADVSESGQDSLTLDEKSVNEVFATEVEKLKNEQITQQL